MSQGIGTKGCFSPFCTFCVNLYRYRRATTVSIPQYISFAHDYQLQVLC